MNTFNKAHKKSGHHKAAYATRHPRDKSHTLMRSAVKKPGLSFKRQINISSEVSEPTKVVLSNPLAEQKIYGSKAQPLMASAVYSPEITSPSSTQTQDEAESLAVVMPETPLEKLIQSGLDRSTSHLETAPEISLDKSSVLIIAAALILFARIVISIVH